MTSWRGSGRRSLNRRRPPRIDETREKQMKRLRSRLVCIAHGALLGAFTGIVAGGAEYLGLLWNHAFSTDAAKAYWDITLVYAIVGLAGGALVGLVVGLMPPGRSNAAQGVAWVYTLFPPLVVLAYLLVWSTYRLGVPLTKLSNLLAYAASVLIAVALGAVLKKLSGAGAAGPARDRAASGGLPGAKLAVALGVLGLILLLGPPFWLERAHAVRTQGRTSWAGLGQQDRPNVVFIVIGETGADHRHMYGYSG